MSAIRPVLAACPILLILGMVAAAQQPASTLEETVSNDGSGGELLAAIIPAPPFVATGVAKADSLTTCKSLDLHTAAALSFKQRVCFYQSRLTAPSFAARAAIFSAFGQLRNEPNVGDKGAAEFGRRFGVYYARRAGQSTGELLAGYLNHEDPRFHASHQQGIWRRAKAAMLSVALTTNEDGDSRLAIGPIAGAFGSGMVGVACYRTNNSFGDGFRRSGYAYGGYFGTALLREFKPDLTVLASRLLHRRSQY